MSKKRFTDTDKWLDPWFHRLPFWAKGLFTYVCDRCDNAGVWEADVDRAVFDLGIEGLDLEEALELFVGRVRVIDGGKWHLIKFIDFQYPTGLNPKSPPHAHVLKLLARHGISCPSQRVSDTPSDGVRSTPMDKDKEREEEAEGDSSARATPPTTSLPLSQTKPGIMELRAIPGLQLLPDSIPGWLSLLEMVGPKAIEAARDEVILSGRKCYQADVYAAAVRIHNKAHRSAADLAAHRREEAAEAKRAGVIEEHRIKLREESIALISEIEMAGRVDECDQQMLTEIRKAIAYSAPGTSPMAFRALPYLKAWLSGPAKVAKSK